MAHEWYISGAQKRSYHEFESPTNKNENSIALSAGISAIRQARDICQQGVCVHAFDYDLPKRIDKNHAFVYDATILTTVCYSDKSASAHKLNESFKYLAIKAIRSLKGVEMIMNMLIDLVQSCVYYEVGNIFHHQLHLTPWFHDEEYKTNTAKWNRKVSVAKGLWFTPFIPETSDKSIQFKIFESNVLMRTTTPVIAIVNIDAFTFKEFVFMLKRFCSDIYELQSTEMGGPECMPILTEASTLNENHQSRDKDLPKLVCTFFNGWQLLHDTVLEYQCVISSQIIQRHCEVFVSENLYLYETLKKYVE
jgi:hypothetical protein